MIRRLHAGWGRLRRPLSPAVGYALWAPTYPDRAENELMRVEERAVLALLPDVAGRLAGDVGCGSGRYLRLLGERGARLVGVDTGAGMLARARRWGVPLLQAALPQLPLRSQALDVVVCGLVVGHLPELGPALEELARVLRPGGVLVYSDLHPGGARRGWRRSFVGEDGRAHTIRFFVHGVDAHHQACRGAGLTIEALAEPAVEAEGRHHGVPAALVVRARRGVRGAVERA